MTGETIRSYTMPTASALDQDNDGKNIIYYDAGTTLTYTMNNDGTIINSINPGIVVPLFAWLFFDAKGKRKNIYFSHTTGLYLIDHSGTVIRSYTPPSADDVALNIDGRNILGGNGSIGMIMLYDKEFRVVYISSAIPFGAVDMVYNRKNMFVGDAAVNNLKLCSTNGTVIETIVTADNPIFLSYNKKNVYALAIGNTFYMINI